MTTATRTRESREPRLGLRENLAQFSLLVAVNALVGGMLGQERTVLPLLAHAEFGLTLRIIQAALQARPTQDAWTGYAAWGTRSTTP